MEDKDDMTCAALVIAVTFWMAVFGLVAVGRLNHRLDEHRDALCAAGIRPPDCADYRPRNALPLDARLATVEAQLEEK